MSRWSQAGLVRLSGDLSARRLEVLEAVASLRLVSAGQIRRRFYGSGSAAARLARLDLAALHEAGLLHRLERRIGGLHAGSSGFVYALGAAGQRLLELRAGEGLTRAATRYEPSLGFVEHALAVSEVWVGLYEHLHTGLTSEPGARFDFLVERQAWRRFVDGSGVAATLKPDAELHLRRGGFEDRWWLEIDRATERRSALRRQLAAYVAYYRTGLEQQAQGLFPLTAWLTVTEPRAQVLREVIGELRPGEQRLFRVGLLGAASPLLLSHGRSEP